MSCALLHDCVCEHAPTCTSPLLTLTHPSHLQLSHPLLIPHTLSSPLTPSPHPSHPLLTPHTLSSCLSPFTPSHLTPLTPSPHPSHLHIPHPLTSHPPHPMQLLAKTALRERKLGPCPEIPWCPEYGALLVPK